VHHLHLLRADVGVGIFREIPHHKPFWIMTACCSRSHFQSQANADRRDASLHRGQVRVRVARVPREILAPEVLCFGIFDRLISSFVFICGHLYLCASVYICGRSTICG